MHSIKLIRHECLDVKDLHVQGSACKGQKTILLTHTDVSHFVLCINKHLCKKENQTLSYSCLGVYGLHQGSNKAWATPKSLLLVSSPTCIPIPPMWVSSPSPPAAENQAQLAAKQMKKASSLCHSQLPLLITYWHQAWYINKYINENLWFASAQLISDLNYYSGNDTQRIKFLSLNRMSWLL